MSAGVLDVLNVGLGHLKITFDKDDVDEMLRARNMINEMFKRGYTIFVEIGGEPVRVRRFDATIDCYIVDEADAQAAEKAAEAALDADLQTVVEVSTTCGCGKARGHRGRCPGSRNRAVPVATARGTAVARTAGG